MFRYLVLAYFLVLTTVSCSNEVPIENEVTHDQELVFAMVVNRHGERSPDADELSLSDQQAQILNLTYLEGLEGLTNVGKRRAYQIGKFYRQRYGSQGHQMISNLYLRDEIAIRSTDKERTKMTIQVAMAAVYPPEVEQQWDEGLGKVWQPVPYSAEPLYVDFLRYYSNCDRFLRLMAEAKQQSLEKEFLPYMDLIPLIYQQTGQNFTENPIKFETLIDLYKSMRGLGLEIPEWTVPVWSKLEEASKLAYRLYFRTDEMKKIGGGVLLSQFTQAADDLISGKQVTQRLRLFSSHDFNLGALMEVTHVSIGDSNPEYGAVFALELYRSRSTGQFSVLPVYLPQAGESTARKLRINGCGSSSYCPINKFKELTKDFLMPEQEYYALCKSKPKC